MPKTIKVFVKQEAQYDQEKHLINSAVFEARLYLESGSYFAGTGHSDAEAIGALVGNCSSELGLEIAIVSNPEGIS